MRNILLLLATSTTLAACGGAGPTSVGSNAVAAAGATTGTTATSTHTFVSPTETKTYQAQGAAQQYSYNYTELLYYDKVPKRDVNGNIVNDPVTGQPIMVVDKNSRTIQDAFQDSQLYTSEARTVRNPGITVTYDPRNAQFSLQINQNGETQSVSFQDPAHRTDFAGAATPQDGVPNLEIAGAASWRERGVQYLQASTGNTPTVYDVSTFFYELPGTTTKYVTYAGFVRNHVEADIETTQNETNVSLSTSATRKTKFNRMAFVFGEQTPNSAVPKTGTAAFTGNMIASMVNNPAFDTNPFQSTYFQWLKGTADVKVDFGASSFTTTLNGTTLAPLYDQRPILTPTNLNGQAYNVSAIPAGAIFKALGGGRVDLVSAGGFVGTFSSASFQYGTTTSNVDIVGSTIDGAFYGPKANEIGASFRIVGGIPDQRVDIIGSFTGK
jgi:predicted small lipoprotein YifL